MDPNNLFVDQRFSRLCVYCGSQPSTRDHVPSKVLLDEPFPADLPVVEACEACNNGFSPDEVYVACFVECVIVGSVSLIAVSREKVRRILGDRPALASLIATSRQENQSGNVLWKPDLARICNVVLKLARGHAAYESGEPQLDEPQSLSLIPLHAMSAGQRKSFETPAVELGWPEIGSRAFVRALVLGSRVFTHDGWEVVQPGRYRYLVCHSGPIAVRLVLSEYLACEVSW